MKANQPALHDRRNEQHTIYPTGHNLEIVAMPNQKMAVMHLVGDPDRVMHFVLPALYSSVHDLNSRLHEAGKDFRVGHLRVRWPDARDGQLVLREEWHGVWGLPIPSDAVSLPVATLPRSFPQFEVEIETWEYGTVAQITHAGPSIEEELDIEHLERFIVEHGYDIAGPLEEEYLAGPELSIQKTLVRYPVRKSQVTTILSAQRVSG
jgi:hypothetical protein